MPELPEVQTVVTDLIAANLTGRGIDGARVFWPPTIASPSPALFCRRIQGKRIDTVGRRGKLIVMGLSSGLTLLIHLRMAGRLLLGQPTGSPHLRVALDLNDGRELGLVDTRKFGRIILSDDPRPILDRLGPEPLDTSFTPARLAERLRGRGRMLKALLLDQQAIAGIGNIYADEALWEARLHPTCPAGALDAAAITALHQAIVTVLARGIANHGTTLSQGKTGFHSANRQPGQNRDTLAVFRRAGLPCPRCGTAIEKMRVSQRGTHFCPCCQHGSRYGN